MFIAILSAEQASILSDVIKLILQILQLLLDFSIILTHLLKLDVSLAQLFLQFTDPILILVFVILILLQDDLELFELAFPFCVFCVHSEEGLIECFSQLVSLVVE